MMNSARQRIIGFLQLARCSYRIDGNRLITDNATLSFTEQDISIERSGKPSRSMPYAKLNLDRLLALITAQAERKAAR